MFTMSVLKVAYTTMSGQRQRFVAERPRSKACTHQAAIKVCNGICGMLSLTVGSSHP